MIDASSFRDHIRSSIRIGFDWETDAHFAEIGVSSQDGESPTIYRISGLSEYNISDDFRDRYISFCTLLIGADRVYLSLDPCDEGTESDQDNYTFTGRAIAVCR
jgi:hypothetical protein